MSSVSALSPAVRDYLRGFVARGQWLSLLRGTGIASAAFLATLLVSCAIDRLLQLPWPVRLALLCAGSAPALSLIGAPIARLLRRDTDWVAAAQRIEQQDPRFDQRLVTVISRLLGDPEHRGSDQILDHLVFELDQEVAGRNSAGLLPLRPVVTPWIAVAVLLLLALAGARVSGVALPALAHRFVAPLADLPPVTTTQLRVTPGNRDLAQSSSVQIEAEVDHLSSGSAWLMTSSDGRNWSRLTMNPTADGHFLFTLGSVDRDLRYYVTAGDAQSPQYDLRVLRRPAVSEFRLRYIYPTYTGRPPLALTNTDGVIEAPVGTEVVMTVVSTEPLQSALLTVGGEKTLMTQTGAENARQGRLTVLKDDRYDLDLISTREQSGTGPGTMSIRAQPDRPPVVRLLGPAGPLCLQTQDNVAVTYEASDDYGLDAVDVRAFVNGVQTKEVALAPPDTRPDAPPARQRQGTVVIDLAALPLHLGDAVSVAVTARDSAGGVTSSDRLPILIAPHRVDRDVYDRLVELDAARRAAELLESELAGSLAAVDPAGATPRAPQSTRITQARLNRGLAEAAEAATMVRRSLLRATVHCSSPRLCDSLAKLIDAAQQDASTADAMFRAGGEPSADPRHAADPLHQLRDSAAGLVSDLRTLAAGERASLIVANRENLAAVEALRAPTDAKAADARKRSLERLRVAIASWANELGVDPAADDAADKLQARIEEADRLMSAMPQVDFVAAAEDWSKHLGKKTAGAALDERLSAAAQAQAVRPDADWARARDLQLAFRAAAVIQSMASDRSSPRTAAQFVLALKSLERERALTGRRSTTEPSKLPDEVKEQAAAARQALWKLGDEGDVAASHGRPGRAELLAYQANAEAAAANPRTSRDFAESQGQQRDNLNRQIAMERLALLPSMRPILQPNRGGDALAGALPDKLRPQGSPGRDWRRNRPREVDVVSGPHESDPSEYEPALRAYFDAINKARDAGK